MKQGVHKGFCNHKGREARLDCFHRPSKIKKETAFGKLLLENNDGYVQLFLAEEVRVIE